MLLAIRKYWSANPARSFDLNSSPYCWLTDQWYIQFQNEYGYKKGPTAKIEYVWYPFNQFHYVTYDILYVKNQKSNAKVHDLPTSCISTTWPFSVASSHQYRLHHRPRKLLDKWCTAHIGITKSPFMASFSFFGRDVIWYHGLVRDHREIS